MPKSIGPSTRGCSLEFIPCINMLLEYRGWAVDLFSLCGQSYTHIIEGRET